MIEKIVEEKIIIIPFQSISFFGYFFVSILFVIFGIFLILSLDQFKLMGIIIIFGVYMIPTLVGFDLLSSYQDKFDIPKLIHPKRWMIFILNLILGWTIILWIYLLYVSFFPGKISAKIVSYKSIK